MSYNAAMTDIESMGVGPNAAVVQIAFVAFNTETGEVSPDYCYVNVDLSSSLLHGGEVDSPTVQWWRNRDFRALSSGGPARPLPDALRRVSGWFSRFPGLETVWAQGPSFDIACLEGYYKRLNREAPWAYNRPRDTRTIYWLAKEVAGWSKTKDAEPKHDALADCRIQVRTLMSALGAIRLASRPTLELSDGTRLEVADLSLPFEGKKE